MNTGFEAKIKSDITVSLRVQDCPTCGVIYAITDDLAKRRQADGGSWYCPNGHSIMYRTPDVEMEREKAAEEELKRRRAEEALANARLELKYLGMDYESEKRSKAAIKGQLTKVKKRVAHGVCPCCNRTFANLARHMSGQHPEYATEAAGAARGGE